MKIFVLAVYLVIFSSSAIVGQDTTKTFNNEIHIEFLSIGIRSYTIGYTREYGTFSTILAAGYRYRQKENKTIKAFKIKIEERLNLFQWDSFDDKKSIYISPFLKYEDATVELSQGKDLISTTSFGLHLGHHLVIEKRFVIDFHIGFMNSSSKINSFVYPVVDVKNFWEPGYNGLKPDVNLLLGYKF